jgi:hypothetical protein
MNPADVKAAKLVPTEGQPAGAVAGPHDDLEEQLRVSVETLLHPSPPSIPADEVDGLLLAITHHLDNEASERKKIYNRLLAIQSDMEGLAPRGLTRYLAVLCIALAVILAWLSYGEATKQIIARRAPASWVQQLGWTKPPAGPESTAVRPPAPQTLASTSKGAAPSPDPQQIQRIEMDIVAVRQAVERHLADVRATVEQLAASQDQMAREIEKLRANQEMLEKIPTPPPKRPVVARKPTPTAPSRSQAPIPPRPPSHP